MMLLPTISKQGEKFTILTRWQIIHTLKIAFVGPLYGRNAVVMWPYLLS